MSEQKEKTFKYRGVPVKLIFNDEKKSVGATFRHLDALYGNSFAYAKRTREELIDFATKETAKQIDIVLGGRNIEAEYE